MIGTKDLWEERVPKSHNPKRKKVQKGRESSGKSRLSWGGTYSPKKSFRDRIVAVAVVAVVLAGVGAFWWRNFGAEQSIQNLAEEGSEFLSQVEETLLRGIGAPPRQPAFTRGFVPFLGLFSLRAMRFRHALLPEVFGSDQTRYPDQDIG